MHGIGEHIPILHPGFPILQCSRLLTGDAHQDLTKGRAVSRELRRSTMGKSRCSRDLPGSHPYLSFSIWALLMKVNVRCHSNVGKVVLDWPTLTCRREAASWNRPYQNQTQVWGYTWGCIHLRISPVLCCWFFYSLLYWGAHHPVLK